MANEAKSPITALAERLARQTPLKNNRVPVYPWRKSQAARTDARRIVLYPHKASTVEGGSVPEALCDLKQVMVADCWGRDGEEAWAIFTWLIQALDFQGRGSDEDAGDPASGAGYWWQLLGADWDVEADTSTQGETVSVLFEVRFSVVALPYDPGHLGAWPTGQINAVQQDEPETRETTDDA